MFAGHRSLPYDGSFGSTSDLRTSVSSIAGGRGGRSLLVRLGVRTAVRLGLTSSTASARRTHSDPPRVVPPIPMRTQVYAVGWARQNLRAET